MSNRDAVANTIKALEVEGRLTSADAAIVQMVEGLADAVDNDPGNASLWREFRAALETLRTLNLEVENDQDEISIIIAALRGSASVQHGKNAGAGHVGRGGGKAVGAVGAPVDAVAAPRRRSRVGDGGE
jgi:hypothetical protein